ncbi:MAG: response regulator [Leptospiraceae bacterium]|nr:response regulator [Leptospiraceae bacterium]
MNKLIVFFFLIYSSFLYSQSEEETILINSDKEILNIGKKMYLLEDTQNKLTIEDIQKPEYQKMFKKSEEEIPNFNSSHGKIWVKFTVLNQTEKEIILEVGESTAWYIDFYKPNPAGKPELATKTGMMRPIENREVDNNFFLFELSKSPEKKSYYFSIQSESTFIIPVRLGSTKSLFESSYPHILFLGMFSGFIFIMFFYNLFVYFSVRVDVYLYYCGYLFFGLFVNNFISGNFGYKWNPISYFSEYFMFFLFVSSFFIIIFLIKLLQIGKRQLFFYITLGYLFLCFVFMVINVATGTYTLIIDIFQISTLFVYLYIFQYSIFYYIKGNKSARFVVFGFSFYLMGIAVAVLQNFGIVPTNFFTGYSVVFGTSVELMMFSLALADRINKSQKDKEEALLEKQKAQFELLENSKENEKKIRAQNIELIATQNSLVFAEQKAQTKSRFLEAVALTNTYLLKENDWKVALQKGFEVIGNNVGVDRVYFFEKVNTPESESILISQKIEWVSKFAKAEIDNPELQNLQFETFKEMSEKILNNQIFSVSRSNSSENFLHTILIPQNIYSLVAVPIFLEGKFFGFIGFDDCREEREISSEEINILLTLSSNLATTVLSKKAQSDLMIAKEKAEAGSKEKTEFLANMSHEIRTPLNAVIGFTELLKNTELTKIQKQFVDNANLSAQTLLAIINDILDFSKIEAGMLDIENIKTDLIEVFKDCFEIVKFSADKKAIQLLLDIDSQMPRFGFIDPIRLKQILLNLLSNAIKFTEIGEVELKVVYTHVENSKGKLSFTVRDTGIGIKNEQKEKLFKAFSQADSSTTRKFGGTGLGLIISELIAKKFGSKIELESEYGKGTTFYFHIVIDFEEDKKNTPEPVPVIEDSEPIENWKDSENRSVQNKSKFNILIVDDVDLNLKLLQNIFENFFPESKLLEATNGKEAISAFLETKLDLIIMDIQMPVMDGLEATRNIRKLEEKSNKNIPIIAITAGTSKEEEEKCFAAGMNDFLSKPVAISKLKNILDKYFANL